MLKACLLVLFICYFPIQIDAQELEHNEFDPVIFEAYYIGEGMSWIQGKFLIARIYPNGDMEYEDISVENYQKKVHFKKSKISDSDFMILQELLRENEINSLSDKYDAFSSMLDHTENLILNISQNNIRKSIFVENFKPELPKAKANYPDTLVKLACWGEYIRKEAKVNFFFRESKSCLNELFSYK